jgi:hypothetical protein
MFRAGDRLPGRPRLRRHLVGDDDRAVLSNRRCLLAQERGDDHGVDRARLAQRSRSHARSAATGRARPLLRDLHHDDAALRPRRDPRPGSIREFTNARVGKDAIAILLRAAVHAPTAMHLEPWSFMLAATALGLGTCPIGFALPALTDPETKRELGIPDDVTAIAPIIVGFAAGSPPPQQRREPQILAWKE